MFDWFGEEEKKKEKKKEFKGVAMSGSIRKTCIR